MLIENFEYDYDPILDNVFVKNYQKKGGNNYFI